MKSFEKFEIENQEMIFGGERIPCVYSGADGSTGADVYDTATDKIVYF